jgi:hypothetical protein
MVGFDYQWFRALTQQPPQRASATALTQFTIGAGRASLQLEFNLFAIAAGDDRLLGNHARNLESNNQSVEFDTKLR